MSNTVLVTGGFGLVGSATVRRLAELGRNVVATDLDTPANRKAAVKLPSGVNARWTDLTDYEQVQRLVSDVAPDAIVHLAAVIAPAIYPIPKVARRVNVDATANLVRVVEGLPKQPRFVHASSITVMGPRNPHRTTPPLRAEDPMRPYDVYSGQKSEAEEIVRASKLEWVVLRLGAVLSPDMGALPVTTDAMYFQAALPSDGRVQTVDVRDVAWAFAAATTADVAREILLIGGDDSHRLTSPRASSRLWVYRAPCHRAGPGIRTATTIGSSPTGWTPPAPKRSCISRTTRGPNYGPNCRRSTVRVVMARRPPYRNAPGQYADPWGKYVPNWASRYGIGPKRFQRRRFHARPTAVTRADQNCIW
jgi:nucleoside-diphosphate-sugar epimerase